jgi:asparagine synthase (glutamine-hydrolysing)
VMARILAHNFETYLPYDLLVKSDRASMLHSLELRSPFLDTALIEYAARLPARLLRRGTRTKWILRHAFRDLVPEAILRRPKMGFGVPLGAWFRGDLKPYLLDHFGAGAELYEYLSPEYVARLLSEHFAGRADHGHRIWLLLTTQLWLRQLGRTQVAAA